MRESQPKEIRLQDYAPPPFLVERVELDIDIRADDAIVRATLAVRRNGAHAQPLVLDGDELELLSVVLDGKAVEYKVTPETLAISGVPDAFMLETVARIVPQKNTKLEGLYATKSGFVTQCEAQEMKAGSPSEITGSALDPCVRGPMVSASILRCVWPPRLRHPLLRASSTRIRCIAFAAAPKKCLRFSEVPSPAASRSQASETRAVGWSVRPGPSRAMYAWAIRWSSS